MIILFIAISIYLAIYDLRYKKVPNRINLVLLILTAGYRIYMGEMKLAVISGAIALVVFSFIYIASKGGIGIGDIKYTAISATFLGYDKWFYSIIFSCIAALLVTIPLLLTKKINRRTKIPFMPFLIWGVITTSILHACKLY